jgi:V/A-type H+-transporting ATPase subunit K
VARPGRGPLAIGLIAVGAALAVGLTALATGIAQSRIGAAGAGTIAEKPENAGTIILLVAIPETMVILGFVIAIVLVFTL